MIIVSFEPVRDLFAIAIGLCVGGAFVMGRHVGQALVARWLR